jgi:hypothetical protein
MGGTLGDLEVLTANGDIGDVNVACLSQNPMSRISEGDNCICSPISFIGNAEDKFNLKCPVGNVGFCFAFLVDLQASDRRMDSGAGRTHDAGGVSCFSSVSTVELEGRTLVSMRDSSIGD